VTVAPAKLERLLERLDSDSEFYAENCLRIVDRRGQLVPLTLRPGPAKLEQALQAQRAAGKPMRAVVAKARQTGVSTWAMGKMLQHISRRENRKARVIAHDDETAQALFEIGSRMYTYLPEEVKPPLKYGQRGRVMEFGIRQRYSTETGPGFNSSLRVDTAGDVEGGRGQTFFDLHCSEAAFWKDMARKMLSLLSAVPDTPDTMVVVESSPNGFNEFKDFWDAAVAGENAFAAVFIAWYDEPSYTLSFASPEEEAEFAENVGLGPYGDAEADLRADGITLEQLNWRRWAIANKCGGSIERFKQEFPSNALEAFLATGSRVFEPRYVDAILRREKPAVERCALDSENDKPFVGKAGALVIPGDPVLKPSKDGLWQVWERPETPEDRYVVAVDVSGGEMVDGGAVGDVLLDKTAWHAIQVINHRTRKQAARYRSRIDYDKLARQAFLAATFWNRAWLAIEVTGGFGMPVARIVRRDFRYPFQYQRKKLDRAHFDSSQDRIGWDTNRITRPLIIENAVRLVRDGEDGINDEETAKEMLTFVRDEKGRAGAERGKFDDMLMAWMIAQYVAFELPPRVESKSTSTSYFLR
jgi:hypothetical protein